MATLAKPYPYKAAINLDMVGFNPITDRLDLLWYTNASTGLRDRVLKANDMYRIGVSPLNAQFAADGNTHDVDLGSLCNAPSQPPEYHFHEIEG